MSGATSRQVRATRLPAIGVLAAVLLGLPACSLLQSDRDPELEYRQAPLGKPLETPPDLIGPDGRNAFQIPEASAIANAPINPATVLPRNAEWRVVRAGGQVWLEVEQTPTELWPQIQAFWRSHEYPLERDEPLLGIQETAWVERRPVVPRTGLSRIMGRLFSSEYSGSLLDKFRVRLERKPVADNPPETRVFLTHWGLGEESVGETSARDVVDTVWVWKGSDPELRAELLNRLLVYLGVEAQLAQGILSAEAAARLRRDAYLETAADGQRSLLINSPYPIAWARVTDALESVGLSIEDSDQNAGRFEVGYIGLNPKLVDAGPLGKASGTASPGEADGDAGNGDPSGGEPGLFARVFSTEDSVERNFRVRLIQEPGQTRLLLDELDSPSVSESLSDAFYQRLLEQLD